MRYEEPRPEDYASEEEYREAVQAYKDALYWEEEMAMERYYDK